MSAAPNAAFKVGLVQMRSGVDPQINLATTLAAIEEAAGAGAAYVLTPEMTNIMEIKRDKLFASIADEERDPTLAALREAARKLSIYIHVGSLAVKASPDKAANEHFVDDLSTRLAALSVEQKAAGKPLISYVESGTKDVHAFFEDSKWVYAEKDDLQSAYDTLDFQIAVRSGLVADLGFGPAPVQLSWFLVRGIAPLALTLSLQLVI